MAFLPEIPGARPAARPTVADRLPGFLRVLREDGFSPGIAETIDASRVLAAAPVDDIRALREGWKALVSGEAGQWRRFDRLFDAYWLGKGGKRSGTAVRSSGRGRGAIGRPGLPDMLRRAADGDEAGGGESGGGASPAERVAEVDLRHIADPGELEKAHAIAAGLAKRMKRRLGRRRHQARRGRSLDLRRVIHRSIQHGGVPFDLVYRKRRPRPWKLVVFLDVSGSMNLYSSVFMRFVHGIVEHFEEAEAFVFHTRLVHVAGVMREADPRAAMERLSVMASGWSGGTRIGEALATFNRHYAARMLGSRSMVLILSDGFDTAPPELLAGELARIKRRAKRLIWLNPLIGWRDYEPRAAGMAAALPLIDKFLPAHNLQSLMDLEACLAKP